MNDIFRMLIDVIPHPRDNVVVTKRCIEPVGRRIDNTSINEFSGCSVSGVEGKRPSLFFNVSIKNGLFFGRKISDSFFDGTSTEEVKVFFPYPCTCCESEIGDEATSTKDKCNIEIRLVLLPNTINGLNAREKENCCSEQNPKQVFRGFFNKCKQFCDKCAH